MKITQGHAYAWRYSVHRTVIQSAGKQGGIPALGICVHLCPSVVLFCMDTTKRCFLLAAAVVLLLVSCKPKETKVLLGLSEALGRVLADEAARIAGARKQVAIISPDASWSTCFRSRGSL
jgi:hypothetical protein